MKKTRLLKSSISYTQSSYEYSHLIYHFNLIEICKPSTSVWQFYERKKTIFTIKTEILFLLCLMRNEIFHMRCFLSVNITQSKFLAPTGINPIPLNNFLQNYLLTALSQAKLLVLMVFQNIMYDIEDKKNKKMVVQCLFYDAIGLRVLTVNVITLILQDLNKYISVI